MVLFISQDTLVCDAVVYKNTLKTLLYLYSSWKSNSLHEKMYFKNSYHSILFMLLTNQYILALFAQLTFFSFDIFRVMFWSAMLYIPLFFLSLRIINFWHWKSEEVRWKPTEFVGSTALAEQNTHTHTLGSAHVLMHTYYQNSCQCSKVGEVSYSIYSSRFDTCKCINLKSVFTLILIYYDSMPYLFQGDE